METGSFKPEAGRGGGETRSSGLGGAGATQDPTPASPPHLASQGAALTFPALPAGALLRAFIMLVLPQALRCLLAYANPTHPP